jgi:excisionase family DNA binding protein
MHFRDEARLHAIGGLLMTRRQVADLLGVSVKSVQRWQRGGRLKAHVLGKNAVRYAKRDVDAFLRQTKHDGGETHS